MTDKIPYKHYEKEMAEMRKDVMAWKKLPQSKSDLFQSYAKSFVQTFNSARNALTTPEKDFPLVPKRTRLEGFFQELKGWYIGLQLLVVNKDAEIKTEESEKQDDLKRDADIKAEQIKISIRGGKREGAGRKSIGVKKPVSIALPEEKWLEIDNLIQSGKYHSYSEFFRDLVNDRFRKRKSKS